MQKQYTICEEELKEVGKIIILSAGTADIPVAEEAYETAKIMGNCVEKIYDVGVAGIHRLFDNLEKIKEAKSFNCCCWNGWSSPKCCRWSCQNSCNCCSNKCWLWSKF